MAPLLSARVWRNIVVAGTYYYTMAAMSGRSLDDVDIDKYRLQVCASNKHHLLLPPEHPIAACWYCGPDRVPCAVR